MSLHNEIAKVAHELYEKSGHAHGRELENWLKAERLVNERHHAVNASSLSVAKKAARKNSGLKNVKSARSA
ncbi:MAG: DUF2934 domain-containing protein [Nitrospirae bacterium]|nr:DUF2934 domain-containing protein [Nitrospirota bacterium]